MISKTSNSKQILSPDESDGSSMSETWLPRSSRNLTGAPESHVLGLVHTAGRTYLDLHGLLSTWPCPLKLGIKTLYYIFDLICIHGHMPGATSRRRRIPNRCRCGFSCGTKVRNSQGPGQAQASFTLWTADVDHKHSFSMYAGAPTQSSRLL